jgi:hypothetical protein
MADKNNAGYLAPIFGDEIDKYYLNKLWLADQKNKTVSSAVNPFGSQGGGDNPPPPPPPPPNDERPQLYDIKRPITQEIYYENNVAKVKVSMRIYISATENVKKFQVKSTKPISQGGK